MTIAKKKSNDFIESVNSAEESSDAQKEKKISKSCEKK